MTKEEIIKNLEELIEDRESFIDDDPECDIFRQDAETLREAIKLISDTQPDKLDRSRWRGCDYCIGDNPKGVVSIEVPDEINISKSKFKWAEPPQYCPICGCPITDAAWAELERRIGGNDETV